VAKAKRALVAVVLILALGYAGLSVLDPPALSLPHEAAPTPAVVGRIAAPASDGDPDRNPSNRPLVTPSAWNDADAQSGRRSAPRSTPAAEQLWNDYLASASCIHKARMLEVAAASARANQHQFAEDMLRAEARIDADCSRDPDVDHLLGLLRAAALAGHPLAQMTFFPEAVAITLGFVDEAAMDPERLQRLKWESRTYMELAVAAGDFDAAVTLAFNLEDGFYTGQPETAAALHYFRVANRLQARPHLQARIASLEDGD
jgi:hypothetical protein